MHKALLPLLGICLPMLAHAGEFRKSAAAADKGLKSFFAFGLGDRPGGSYEDPFRIRYFNHSSAGSDTFQFRGRMSAGQHLVNLNLSFGLAYHSIGGRIDLGFVPFANRNASQSLSVYGMIPLNEKIRLAPIAGYTRFRKQRKIGELTGRGDSIQFKGVNFEELPIRAVQVNHSLHGGLGMFIQLNEHLHLYLDARYHHLFRERLKLNVRGYKNDGSDRWFEAAISAKERENYFSGEPETDFRDASGATAASLFPLSHFSFSIQLAVRLKSLEEEKSSAVSPLDPEE